LRLRVVQARLRAVADRPSAPVTASRSATAATSPPTSARPSTQAAGPIDVQNLSFVSADQGWALGSGELVTTTDGGAS
jgi:hypothetical protein